MHWYTRKDGIDINIGFGMIKSAEALKRAGVKRLLNPKENRQFTSAISGWLLHSCTYNLCGQGGNTLFLHKEDFSSSYL